MFFRHWLGGSLALCLWAMVHSAMATPPRDPADEKTGGATTVYATGRNAFSFPLANLSDEERTRFVIGNSFFRRNWVEAPASTTARDGLGPHFIARSCGGCHVQDGRGAPPDFKRGLQDQPIGLLLRLSIPGVGEHGGVVPEPTYGDQLNNAAIQGVKPEGLITLRAKPLKGRLPDGTRYTLLQPGYGFKDLAYGPMSPHTLISPRVAPQLIGVGLIESIAEEDILANAREQASMAGPIKGVPNRVWDAMAQRMVIGRFGWKANVGSLAHQSAGAFVGDMGITSPLFPHQTCTPTQKDCQQAPQGGHGEATEIDAQTLEHVVFYQAALAPPARRNSTHPEVLKGQRLFHQTQCATCHRPSYQTGQALFPRLSSPALAGQKIWPYTDLLLHDMGQGLADGRPDFDAHGQQWKTPPLWGIGLIKDVNGHTRLLHDGRARNVFEAILWHGGEAQASRDLFTRLSAAERRALILFVESL
jgi:CxxC motif-containing protein (DUF1111 family)